ncbi:SCP2 domain-containing protein (plasmid) [Rhizobium grahamii]|uniref:SCP2 domain-containing protein n=3 Tax=Rhizobium TaxID=379 RepID=A0A5Q0CFI0_9HYPH|nr:SCP2 domain-containing protein [Rhizobium grahamii]QRM52545.1 SCP2 domain-containing protein [Rhizobium sp. BG6]
MLAPSRLMATARFVPLPIAAQVANTVLKQTLRIHPKLFDRLGEYRTARFAFIPNDFPFSFSIRPADRAMTVMRRGKLPMADATISGPLVLMLALAEGRVDGDALFFSRKLLVTGDMEAVLALRNALDDNEVDLVSTISRLTGPFGEWSAKALDLVRRDALEKQGVPWN